MSKKKKQTKGNPANQVWRDSTQLGAAIQTWSEIFILNGDEDQATLAAAVNCWVGAGDPGRLGLNQCTNACYQIRLILDALGVESHIVPVLATITENDRELATVGTDEPSWTDGFARWSGHTVLALPRQGRILDPTIGQAFPKAPAKERVPLMGRVVETLGGTIEDMTRPGTIWPTARETYVIKYRVLDHKYNPMNDSAAATAMNESNGRLRERLPQLVTQIQTLMMRRLTP